MKIYIASLKFSPGHFSHVIAYSKLFSELGFETNLLISKDYSKMIENSDVPVSFFEDKIPEFNADIILFANPSTINHKMAKLYKKNGTKILYLYHEPFDSIPEYLKEGLKQTIKAIGAHYFSVKLLKLSDLVIVPSNFALNLYKKSDMKYCRNVSVIPLLFDDEHGNNIDINDKEYFSYIGHAVIGHAFDIYLDFIKYAYKKEYKMKFMIATKTDLSDILSKDKIIQEMVSKNVLKITHGRPLKNSEINEAYKKSFCVWNLYRRSTQSGVLPKAFMFGTPVLASNIGSFPEYVKNCKNGYIVETSDLKKYEKLIQSIQNIQNKLDFMSLEARKTFENTFYYMSQIKNTKNILSSFFQNKF